MDRKISTPEYCSFGDTDYHLKKLLNAGSTIKVLLGATQNSSEKILILWKFTPEEKSKKRRNLHTIHNGYTEPKRLTWKKQAKLFALLEFFQGKLRKYWRK